MLNSFVIRVSKKDIKWTMGILMVELLLHGLLIILDILYLDNLLGSVMIHTFMIIAIIYTIYVYFSHLNSYLEVQQGYLVCNKWLHDKVIINFQDVLYIKGYTDVEDGTHSYYAYYRHNNNNMRLNFEMREGLENFDAFMNIARSNHWEVLW